MNPAIKTAMKVIITASNVVQNVIIQKLRRRKNMTPSNSFKLMLFFWQILCILVLGKFLEQWERENSSIFWGVSILLAITFSSFDANAERNRGKYCIGLSHKFRWWRVKTEIW